MLGKKCFPFKKKKKYFKQKLKNGWLARLCDHKSVSHELKFSQISLLLENKKIQYCLHYDIRGQFLQCECKPNALVFYFTGGFFILLSQLANL